MKKIVLRVLSFALILSMALSLLPASFAEDNKVEDKNQHWNIMIVVDATHEMAEKDPTGLRYDAINLFIDTLWKEGDYLGAISTFSPSKRINDRPHNAAIQYEKEPIPSSPNAKREIKKGLANAVVQTKRFSGERDLASAILRAVELLTGEDLTGSGQKIPESGANNNGLPSAIFVITAGPSNQETEDRPVYYKKNLEVMIQKIKENNIVLGGVLLNTDNSDECELKDFVTMGNNLGEGNRNIGKYYFEKTNPAELTDAFNGFLQCIGISTSDTHEIFTKTDEKTFDIPGTGIDELNLRFRTIDGSDLPNSIKIDIFQPNGEALTDNTLNGVEFRGKTYYGMKCSNNPEGGTWRVKVNYPSDYYGEIKFERFFNTSIETELKTNPEIADLHANMNVNVEAFLVDENGKIEGKDKEKYIGYTCRLEMTNIDTGEIEDIEIAQNKDGEFKKDIDLKYGDYLVKAIFSCNEFNSESKEQHWDLTNRAPEDVNADALQINCSCFKSDAVHIDCAKYAKDREDNEFTYELADTPSGGVFSKDTIKLKDGILTIYDPYKAAHEVTTTDNIYVRVIDSQGAAGIITFPVTINVTDIKAEMEVKPPKDELHVNIDGGVLIKAYIIENGKPYPNPSDYKDYECNFKLFNLDTNKEEKSIALLPDGEGNYQKTEELDTYGNYKAYVEFVGPGHPILSEPEIWNLTNRDPEWKKEDEVNSYRKLYSIKKDEEGILHSKIYYIKYVHESPSIEIRQFASDLETPLEDLKIEINGDSSTGNKVEMSEDNSELIFHPQGSERGNVSVKLSDSEGASDNMIIEYQIIDCTLYAIIAAAVLLLLIILLIIRIIRGSNSIIPKGRCNVDYQVPVDGDLKTINYDLTPPGNGSRRNTNLYDMISSDMHMAGSAMEQACQDEHVDFREAEKFIEDLASDLRRIEVCCVNQKQKGLGKVGKVKVTEGKNSKVLYNTSMKVLPGGQAFTISYYDAQNVDFDY